MVCEHRLGLLDSVRYVGVFLPLESFDPVKDGDAMVNGEIRRVTSVLR